MQKIKTYMAVLAALIVAIAVFAPFQEAKAATCWNNINFCNIANYIVYDNTSDPDPMKWTVGIFHDPYNLGPMYTRQLTLGEVLDGYTQPIEWMDKFIIYLRPHSTLYYPISGYKGIVGTSTVVSIRYNQLSDISIPANVYQITYTATDVHCSTSPVTDVKLEFSVITMP